MQKNDKKKLSSVSGRPISENENVRTAGPRGPMLLEDFWFLEKLAHFDREVIPERRMQKVQELMGNLQSPMILRTTPKPKYSQR